MKIQLGIVIEYMTLVGKILLYTHFDASLIDTILKKKFDFFRQRLEIGQFCLLEELNLEVCTISLQTKCCTCLYIHFSVERFCVREYVCRMRRKIMIRFK